MGSQQIDQFLLAILAIRQRNLWRRVIVEGSYSCLVYYQAVEDRFSRELLRGYDERFIGPALSRFANVKHFCSSAERASGTCGR